jgi:hypothetical protein
MKRAYYNGERPKNDEKSIEFDDHAENFYSDKTVHFYHMGFHATYSAIVTLQCNRAIFLIFE